MTVVPSGASSGVMFCSPGAGASIVAGVAAAAAAAAGAPDAAEAGASGATGVHPEGVAPGGAPSLMRKVLGPPAGAEASAGGGAAAGVGVAAAASGGAGVPAPPGAATAPAEAAEAGTAAASRGCGARVRCRERWRVSRRRGGRGWCRGRVGRCRGHQRDFRFVGRRGDARRRAGRRRLVGGAQRANRGGGADGRLVLGARRAYCAERNKPGRQGRQYRGESCGTAHQRQARRSS